MQEIIADIYQSDSRKVLATLIRLLGDFDLAEEAMHEAFAAALRQWPKEGVPGNPSAWLISAARFKAIDQLRKRTRQEASADALAREEEMLSPPPEDSLDEESIADDRLRLIFICCHPGLSQEARLGLTLREVCGLTTEQVASAFLLKPATVAQRIVRAKQKIRSANIPYEIPSAEQLPERLQGVLQVIYLVFNEGYSASSGSELLQQELSSEAIRLCRLLLDLLPEPEVAGLLALMLLQEARHKARVNAEGNLLTLEEQDRNLWDRAMIEEGRTLLTRSLLSRRFGLYTVQAAISAVHSEAASFADTDWQEICALYDVLLQMQPTPVVALNRAVAISMRDGPQAGLELVTELLQGDALAEYYLAHAAVADFCRQLGRTDEARAAYQRALELTNQAPERRFLENRLQQL